MAAEFFGILRDSEVYDIQTLARLLRLRQHRTIRDWCRKNGVPICIGPGQRELVSGYHIRLAIEEMAKCVGDDQ